MMIRPRVRRPRFRRVVVAAPSAFTLGNLFFGVWSIASASRGNFNMAGWLVVLGGLCDAMDGRVARATRTGSRFGEELDSLVDAISFGLAPALIMYFAVLNRGGWDWIFVFIFVACAVLRLARFNVEQAGTAKTHFHGLPSPAAGGTLAVYWWFSQTSLYNETIIGSWPWQDVMRWVMLLLAGLMVSDVSYPAVPTANLRTWRGALGVLFVVALTVGIIFLPREFFFPVAMLYVTWGVVATVFSGLVERIPTGPAEAYEEDEEDDDGRHAPVLLAPPREEAAAGRRRRRRHRPRGDRPTPPINPAVEEGGE